MRILRYKSRHTLFMEMNQNYELFCLSNFLKNLLSFSQGVSLVKLDGHVMKTQD